MADKYCFSRFIEFLLLFGFCFEHFGFCTSFTEAVVCTQRKPLGLSTGRIPSANISSSMSFNANQNFEYTPSQARLNTASSWCGVDNGTWKSDWVQVDFGEQVNLTGIAIQGSHDKPADILTEFYLQMSDNGIEFRNQTNSNGNIKFHKVSVMSGVGQRQYYWFKAFSGKFMRVRASKLLIATAESRFCLSFEVFGCRAGLIENDLYPVGLENGVIQDPQITASSMLSNNPPHHGRLNFPNSWCAAATTNEWLQIDLGHVLRVKRITTQGSYGRSSKDMVSLYLLSYANQSSSSFEFLQHGAVNKTFVGNTKTSEDPVLNVIDTNLIARYIRIHPIAGYNCSLVAKQCMRVEIYVAHPDCIETLTAGSEMQLTSITNGISKPIQSNVDIFSSVSWCATDTNEFLRVDFGSIKLVTGISISGNSNYDSWITKFYARYGFESLQTKILGTGFQGAVGRESIAVHWLKQAKVMKFLDIIPKKYFGNKCLRLRIIGCSTVPIHNYAPNITSVKPGTRSVVIKSKDSGDLQINGTIIKYSCITNNQFAPCSKTNISKWLTGSNNVNLTGLRPWTKYSFSIRHVLSDSWTMETNIVQFTTLEEKPAAAPNSCRVISVNKTSFSLLWNTIPPNSTNAILIGYHISLKKTNLIRNFSTIGSVSGTQYTVKNVSPDTMYTVLVSAVNKAGSGPPCRIDVKTFPEAPKAPQNFTVTKISSTVIRLSWTKSNILGLRYYLLSHKEATTNESFEKLSPNFAYYYFKINNQTGVYEFKVSAHTTVPGLWSSMLVYQANRPVTIKEAETTAGLSFVRKSELALICSATTIVLLAVVILLTQALVERNGMITREKRYVEYMKNIQCENLGNYIKNGKDKHVDREILEDRTAMRQFIEKHTGKKHKPPKLSSPHQSVSSSESVAAAEGNSEPTFDFHSSNNVSSSLPDICTQNGNSSVLSNGASKHDHVVTVAPINSIVKSGMDNPGFEHENDQRKLPPIKSRAPRKSGLDNLGPARNGNVVAWSGR